MNSPKMHRTQGFSLLELSVVLAIIGVVLAGGLTVGLGAMEASRVNETVSRMDAIHKALLNYSINFSRLPCPSSLTLADTNANYGIEGATKGTCTGGTPAANNSAASGTVEGGVPTRTLQLPDEYMYDGWGRHIRYSVNPDYTADDTMPVGTGSCTSTKAITVKDAAAGDRTTNGVYALISHGANGHGGYTRNGVMFNAGSTNTDEQTNCHCNASAVATTYSATYVQKLPTESSSTATDKFDDIVSYRDGWQLQSFTSPLSSTSCAYYVWVTDAANHRVQKFNAVTGAYVLAVGAGYNGAAGSIGSAGTNNDQFNYPAGITTDSSGNLYVLDAGNRRVKVFSSSGAYVTNYNAGYGSANGSWDAAYGITRLSSGDFWVADEFNNRIQRYNSSFTHQQSVGGPAPHTCQTSPAGSPPACVAGSGDGQFDHPLTVAVDETNGYIWVSDRGNNRVVKLNSSGTQIGQLGCVSGACSTGSSNGSFDGVRGLAVDSSGNVYASDTNNNRVQKFTSSGSYVSQIGDCSSGACSYSHASGGFYGMENVAVDSYGNVWVASEADERVQKFDSSGVWQMQLGCASGQCSFGTANGQFDNPGPIAFSTQ